MKDNNLPRYWIVLTWFSHQKNKIQDIICEVETQEWKGDFFGILSSVLTHRCQGNDTAEIRSKGYTGAIVVPFSTCKLTQLQATGHFLTQSAALLFAI